MLFRPGSASLPRRGITLGVTRGSFGRGGPGETCSRRQILVSGTEKLFFLDRVASGAPDPHVLCRSVMQVHTDRSKLPGRPAERYVPPTLRAAIPGNGKEHGEVPPVPASTRGQICEKKRGSRTAMHFPRTTPAFFFSRPLSRRFPSPRDTLHFAAAPRPFRSFGFWASWRGLERARHIAKPRLDGRKSRVPNRLAAKPNLLRGRPTPGATPQISLGAGTRRKRGVLQGEGS